jgi:hypothetical protein
VARGGPRPAPGPRWLAWPVASARACAARRRVLARAAESSGDPRRRGPGRSRKRATATRWSVRVGEDSSSPRLCPANRPKFTLLTSFYGAGLAALPLLADWSAQLDCGAQLLQLLEPGLALRRRPSPRTSLGPENLQPAAECSHSRTTRPRFWRGATLGVQRGRMALATMSPATTRSLSLVCCDWNRRSSKALSGSTPVWAMRTPMAWSIVDRDSSAVCRCRALSSRSCRCQGDRGGGLVGELVGAGEVVVDESVRFGAVEVEGADSFAVDP